MDTNWKLDEKRVGSFGYSVTVDHGGADLIIGQSHDLEVARLIRAAPQLLKACELVLALNDHPEARVPGFWREQPQPRGRPLLDPKAAEQLRAAIALAKNGDAK